MPRCSSCQTPCPNPYRVNVETGRDGGPPLCERCYEVALSRSATHDALRHALRLAAPAGRRVIRIARPGKTTPT